MNLLEKSVISRDEALQFGFYGGIAYCRMNNSSILRQVNGDAFEISTHFDPSFISNAVATETRLLADAKPGRVTCSVERIVPVGRKSFVSPEDRPVWVSVTRTLLPSSTQLPERLFVVLHDVTRHLANKALGRATAT